MKHTQQPVAPVDAIRARVKELRSRRGLSAAGLAEELVGVGVLWNRSIVANFEGGRRPTVSVVEWLALAKVLDVAPVHLLVPPERRPAEEEDPYAVTPNETASRWDVRQWIRGQNPLPGQDRDAFAAEVPPTEYDTIWVPIRKAQAVEMGLIEGGDDGEHQEETER